MSKEELLSALKELDNYSNNNANNARTKKIRDKFLMPKTKQKKQKKTLRNRKHKQSFQGRNKKD